MNKFIKRIQAKLTYKGVKASQPSIKGVYKQLVKDINNPTTDEINAVVERLMGCDDSIATVEQNASGISNDTEQTTQIEETEEMINNTPQESNELTFTNKFEKAGALEKVFVDNSIVATDTELMAISVDIENDFNSEDDFIVAAIKAWEDYRTQLSQARVDTVQQGLANIRTMEVLADNSIKSSMNATSEFIKVIRSKQNKQYKEFIQKINNARIK